MTKLFKFAELTIGYHGNLEPNSPQLIKHHVAALHQKTSVQVTSATSRHFRFLHR